MRIPVPQWLRSITCGHDETEIARLRLESSELGTMRLQLAHAAKERQALRDELEITRGYLSISRHELRGVRTQAAERERELVEALEEATTRLATEAAARPGDGRGFAEEQIPLVPDPTAEAGGEAPIAADVKVSEDVVQRAYRMVGVFFEGRNFWWFARGDERVKAPIHDKKFLERMAQRNVSFVPGDTMVARFKIVKYRTPEGATYESDHVVEEVIRIVPPPAQSAITITELEVADAAAR